MANIQDLIGEFLHELNAIESPRLGPSASNVPTSTDIERLRTSLEQAASRNRKLSFAIVAAHFLVLATVGVILLGFHVRRLPSVAVLGGGGALLLGLLGALRATWREASTQDILLIIIPSLQPSEVLHMLEALSYGRRSKRT